MDCILEDRKKKKKKPRFSEYRVRIAEPSDFQQDTFRYVDIAANIRAVMGKKKGSDSMVVQAFRFPKKHWDKEAAERWVEKHDHKIIRIDESMPSFDFGHLLEALQESKSSKSEKRERFLKMRKERVLAGLKSKWNPIVALGSLDEKIIEPADLKKLLPAKCGSIEEIHKRIAKRLENGKKLDPADLTGLLILYRTE